MRYRTIVADPPWSQQAGPKFDGRGKDTRTLRETGRRTNSTACDLTYPTMSVDEIAALRPPADDDAHLYLWVTNRYIEDAYRVARAWGFRPVVLLTWAKTPRGIGLGGTFVQTTEHVLFSRRGTLPALRRVDSTWWNWTRQDAAHSKKPDAFLDLVESVSPEPRLEMFSRRARLGWHVWGNEVDSHVEVVAS